MKARLFWIAIVVLVVGGVAYRVVQARKAAASFVEKAPEAALVQVAKVARGSIGEKIELTGTVRAHAEVDVFSKIGGRIESLPVQVGDTVKAGAVLASVEHKEIGWQAAAAQAQLQVARANLAGARENFERMEKLFKDGAVPKAQFDGAKTQVALATAQAEAAQASAGLAGQQVANARVESPIAGTVTRRLTQVGAMVGPQAPLFTVQDVSKLKIETSADAASFALLKKGQSCLVQVDSLPGESFGCTVNLLSPALDSSTRRAAVELALDNAKGRLLPNMFAQAVVTVGQRTDALVVPREAVVEQPGGDIVYRVKDGKTQLVRPVFGARDHGQVQVLSGLDEGDQVVTTNVAALADGQAIRVSPGTSASAE